MQVTDSMDSPLEYPAADLVDCTLHAVKLRQYSVAIGWHCTRSAYPQMTGSRTSWTCAINYLTVTNLARHLECWDIINEFQAQFARLDLALSPTVNCVFEKRGLFC